MKYPILLKEVKRKVGMIYVIHYLEQNLDLSGDV